MQAVLPLAWTAGIGEPTGPARSGRPDDKLRDTVLRTAMPGGEEMNLSIQ